MREVHAVNEPKKLEIKTYDTSRTDLKPSTIDPSWILEGTPEARSVTLVTSSDGALTTGLWECTAGRFKWVYGLDEIVHILEGEARVDDGTRTHVLLPGRVVCFPRGLTAIWEVPKFVRKMFVLRDVKRPAPRVVWQRGARFVFEP